MSEAGQNAAPRNVSSQDEAAPNAPATSNVRSLETVMREMKNAAADREDVVVEMREASRTRLELLGQELQPVFADVPADDPAFDFAISSGEQPRLWIDAVAHVVMGRDRRTYRFLRDTRLGRVVLAEDADVRVVADRVTHYIAERMVERQRIVEGEVETLPRARDEDEAAPDPAPRTRGSGWRGLFASLALVVLGGVAGVAALVFFLPERFPEVAAFLARF